MDGIRWWVEFPGHPWTATCCLRQNCTGHYLGNKESSQALYWLCFDPHELFQFIPATSKGNIYHCARTTSYAPGGWELDMRHSIQAAHISAHISWDQRLQGDRVVLQTTPTEYSTGLTSSLPRPGVRLRGVPQTALRRQSPKVWEFQVCAFMIIHTNHLKYVTDIHG